MDLKQLREYQLTNRPSSRHIIDNYDDLPTVSVFMHSLRYQWHNDDPLYGTHDRFSLSHFSNPFLTLRPANQRQPTDGVPMLRNLQLPHIHQTGYVNLRCAWALGCPVQIKPLLGKSWTGVKDDRSRSEAAYAESFATLFPGLPVPNEVGVGCGAQFAVSRSKILERPRADYERYRTWLLETPLADAISGRVMEYSWHSEFSSFFLFLALHKTQEKFPNRRKWKGEREKKKGHVLQVSDRRRLRSGWN